MVMNNDHFRIIVLHSISVRAGNLELIMRINIRKWEMAPKMWRSKQIPMTMYLLFYVYVKESDEQIPQEILVGLIFKSGWCKRAA